MKRIVLLISGRGSNMEAIVQACARERWDAQVVGVLSNRADAAGLAFAQAHGVPTQVVDHQAFADRADFDLALAEAVHTLQPDVVALAGFMRVLGERFVQRFEGRLLNIHPSLLPAFPGLHTHRRALQAGCRLVGATVHFVTPELDLGPIVIQSAVPVRADDDEDSLSRRVLATEHLIYPRAVRWMVEGALQIDGLRVHQRDGQPQWLFVDEGEALTRPG